MAVKDLPKETFFNLPDDKRQRIIDAALDEFASQPYHQASLSRIVAKADIAKGSMYQYFANKFDLYLYLIGLASEVKLAAFGDVVGQLGPDADVFDMLLAASTAGIEAIRAQPRLYMLGNRMLAEGPEFLAKVVEHFGQLSEDIVGEWLQMSIDRGLIDRRVSRPVASFIVNSMLAAVGQAVSAGRLSQEQAIGLLEQIWNIIKLGMKPRHGSAEGDAGQDDRG